MPDLKEILRRHPTPWQAGRAAFNDEKRIYDAEGRMIATNLKDYVAELFVALVNAEAENGEEPKVSALNEQVSGTHYKDMAIQPAEYIYKNALGYLEGNVVKYISRHKSKGKADDVRKAIHYCKLILEFEYGESSP